MDWEAAQKTTILWLKETLGREYVDWYYEDLAGDLLANLKEHEKESDGPVREA